MRIFYKKGFNMFIQDIAPGKEPPKKMTAIIEIPENGVVKYEIDKDKGM